MGTIIEAMLGGAGDHVLRLLTSYVTVVIEVVPVRNGSLTAPGAHGAGILFSGGSLRLLNSIV